MKPRIRDFEDVVNAFNLQIGRLEKLKDKILLENKEMEGMVNTLNTVNNKKNKLKIRELNTKIQELEKVKDELTQDYFLKDKPDDLLNEIEECEQKIKQLQKEIENINSNKDANKLINEFKSNIKELEKEEEYTSMLVDRITEKLQGDFLEIVKLDRKIASEECQKEELEWIKDNFLKLSVEERNKKLHFLKIVYRIENFDKDKIKNFILDRDKLISKHRRVLSKNEKVLKDKYRQQLDIHTFIIDGSNLCYAGYNKSQQQFIGILPLLVLRDFLLLNKYNLHIVFDGNFKSKCSYLERKILEQLIQDNNEKCKVEILEFQTGKADGRILELANQSEFNTYVISNDNYDEYKSSRAVHCEKVVKFSLNLKNDKLFSIQIKDLFIWISLTDKNIEDFDKISGGNNSKSLISDKSNEYVDENNEYLADLLEDDHNARLLEQVLNKRGRKSRK